MEPITVGIVTAIAGVVAARLFESIVNHIASKQPDKGEIIIRLESGKEISIEKIAGMNDEEISAAIENAIKEVDNTPKHG